MVPILNLYSNIKDRERGVEGRDQDIGKGRGRALRVGGKLGTTCGSGPDRVCVCVRFLLGFFFVYCLSSSSILCTQCCQSILDLHFGFFTGAWVQDFVLIKISCLECMCNFRAPWHVLLGTILLI